MGSKNLGIIKAIYIGTTAPTNTNMLWRDTSGVTKVYKEYIDATGQWEPLVNFETFNYTWANLESDTETIGTTSDDVIQLTGAAITGSTRAKVVLTITHDGSTCDLDVNIVPYTSEFISMFTGASISGSDILLAYNVGSLGASVNFKGKLETF